MKSMSLRAAGLLADSINDASSTRKVYMLAGGLALLGILLILITIWFWRSTRHDPELLAPLEVMGDRSFRRLEGVEQRVVLDEKRPSEATPKQWGVQRGESVADPALIARANEDGVVESDAVADAPDPEVVGAVQAAAETDAAAHAELDSMLLAAGAVLPGTVAATVLPPSEAGKIDIDELLGIERPVVANGVVTPSPAASSEGEDATSAVVRPAFDASVVAATENDAPVIEPLLIVPVDHDLRPTISRTVEESQAADLVDGGEPSDGHFDAAVAHDDLFPHDDHDHDPDLDHDLHDDHDEANDQQESIDPLLRMFNRNDS